MIRSGDQFIAGRSGGVIGAIIPWRGGFAGVAPAHIFQQVGTRELRLGLAFFPILAPCQLTILGKPHPGEAELVNARHSIACRVSDSSWSIVYVILPPGDLPGPGDSGSALVQDERVVGLLLSLNMHTCRGTAVSAEMIEREIGK